ncbi:MAG TPA: tetratricopeptide repeat protein, partial [Bdellovibrionota bacterium]|nr:tetratricopeptide repeat protein [Bdellovibrionota bacterium]
MSDIHLRQLQELLARQLRGSGTELVDLIPIPAQGDRMVRLRTLEEALSEWDRDDGDAVSYLIQVRPSRTEKVTRGERETSLLGEREPEMELELEQNPGHKPVAEGVYLSSGKINLPFLLRNADLLVASGDWTLARNIYKTILASGEHAAAALAGMGRCLEAEGKLEEARAKYDESIAYQPSLDSYRLLGTLLIRLGKDELAGDAFDRALSLKDLQRATRFELSKAAGNCFTRARRLADAERLYHRAL